MSLAERKELLTRDEVAERLRVSIRTFDRRVARHLPRVAIGSRILFDWEDVLRWLESQKAGPFSPTDEPVTCSVASRTTGGGTISPRARQILAKRRSKQRGSTPRLYPVGGNRNRSGGT